MTDPGDHRTEPGDQPAELGDHRAELGHHRAEPAVVARRVESCLVAGAVQVAVAVVSSWWVASVILRAQSECGVGVNQHANLGAMMFLVCPVLLPTQFLAVLVETAHRRAPATAS